MSDTIGARMKVRGLIATPFLIIGGWIGASPIQEVKPTCISNVGRVQVKLFEPGTTRSKHTSTIFNVDAVAGTASQGPPGSVWRTAPAGAFLNECDRGVEIPSPDGRMIATCKEELSEKGGVFPVVLVVDSKTKSTLARVPLSTRSALGGFAWSPDSQALAYLIKQQTLGRKPLDLLSAAAGHPVPYNSYGVEILCVATSSVRKVPNIIQENAYGLASIRWFTPAGD